MSLPKKITLTGRYVKTTGVIPTTDDVPETGTITIISSDYVFSEVDNVICPPHKITIDLDTSGSFSASVISTNDPAWLPVNRTLTIKENLSGGSRTYSIAVPYDSPADTLDLADAQHVVSPSAPVTYVLVNSFTAKGDLLVGTGAASFTRLGVGANSQVLSVDSSTPTGLRWISGGGGGGISPVIIDAKGDLIVGVAPDVPDRLGIGSDGQFLKAAASQTAGMLWASITKSDVGLGNVDNTSDANKPVSNATATALAGKSSLGHTHTEADVTGLTADLAAKEDVTAHNADVATLNASIAGKQDLDSDLTAIAGLAPANNDVIQRKAGAWINRTPAQLKIDLALTKSDVGLANVDNTSDASKPVSTLQNTAINNAVTTAENYTDTAISGLTKASVGLANVDNTSDVTKFASTPLTGATTADSITVNKRLLVSPDTITISAGNADTDASLGNHFKIAANANFTLTTPTNPSDTQKVLWQITQDATGSRVMTLSSAFVFGTDITAAVLSTAANKTDLLGAIYDAASSKWRVALFIKGFA